MVAVTPQLPLSARTSTRRGCPARHLARTPADARGRADPLAVDGFLLDMNKLFEDFVTVALHEVLREQSLTARLQDLHYLDSVHGADRRPRLRDRLQLAWAQDGLTSTGWPGSDLMATLAGCRRLRRRPRGRLPDVGLSVHAVTINALDPASLAAFWAAALGGTVKDSGNGYILVEPSGTDAPRLVFAPVDEHRHSPGRIHLDLSTGDKGQEVRRLVSLGARVTAERSDSKFRWTVLTDPEGNPFCI